MLGGGVRTRTAHAVSDLAAPRLVGRAAMRIQRNIAAKEAAWEAAGPSSGPRGHPRGPAPRNPNKAIIVNVQRDSMASTTTTISSVSAASVRESVQRVPWYVWCAVLGVTSAMIGGQWDVSWHRSIGRDTFWTPAHMAIYLCGVLAGISCGYLILRATFAPTAELISSSVRVFGFRGPLGAFIAAWGGIAMITSAPFDNWWHAAYGLDVKIVSPPHTLLILGIRAVGVGVLFLILAAMNRASDGEKGFDSLQRLFLYMGGLIISGQMFFLMEYTWDVYLHSSTAYVAM